MAPPSSPATITTGGKERLSHAIPLLANVFLKDPVITYMVNNLSAAERRAYQIPYFKALLTAAALNDASFTEADGWMSAGVLMPPGSKVDNPWTIFQAGLLGVLWKLGFAGCWRMLAEFTPIAEKCKAKALKGEKNYYYVFFLGTVEEARGKGLASAIIKDWQELATQEQLPIWLEATTEYSMNLYKDTLGFKVVGDEMVLGKGKVGADGLPRGGGEGVRIWGMVWRPEEKKHG